MLISTAYAQAIGGAGGDSFLISMLPLVLIFVIFYFLLIRPQQKRAKEHRELLSNIRRGDRIVTNGGLMGTVAKVSESDDTLQVEIAQGVRVQIVRAMVSEVRGKGQPISSGKGRKGKDKDKANDDTKTEDDAEGSDAEGADAAEQEAAEQDAKKKVES